MPVHVLYIIVFPRISSSYLEFPSKVVSDFEPGSNGLSRSSDLIFIHGWFYMKLHFFLHLYNIVFHVKYYKSILHLPQYILGFMFQTMLKPYSK